MSIVTIMNSIFASKQGRPSTLRQWCIFHPLFQISPLFARNCSDSVENFPSFTFSEIFFGFSSSNISDDLFLVTDQKFWIPLFSLFQYISPYFGKFFFCPLLFQISPDFVKFTRCLHTLCVFRFPLLWLWCIYASQNARTGRHCREAS